MMISNILFPVLFKTSSFQQVTYCNLFWHISHKIQFLLHNVDLQDTGHIYQCGDLKRSKHNVQKVSTGYTREIFSYFFPL